MTGPLISDDGRTHIKSGLMRESLVSKALNEATEGGPIRRMVPDVNFIAIGGQSIMDRGSDAVMPLVESIVALRKKHKLVIGVGGGARVRHTYAIGIDLGLPIGGLARVMGAVEEQNRDLLVFLLAPYGGLTFIKDHLQDLPMWLDGGMIPVCIGQPPYHFWEPPPKHGRLPENGTDVGLFLMAESIGAARMIYVKDVDGLYSANPKSDAGAMLIPEITARRLMDMNLPDLPSDRELLPSLEHARLVQKVHLVNGLNPSALAQVFNGDTVGSTITAGREGGQS
ncbi:MAG: uridine kinase [Nitrospiraceae bacterium]